MPVLQASQIADLIVSAQNDLGRYKWTDLSYDLQRYTAVPQLFTKRKVTFSSGPAIQWNLFIGTSGAAHDTGLFAVDDVNISDVLHTANIPWRHWNTNYAIERREIAMNGSPAKIVDLVKTRRHDAVVDMVKHGEKRFWGAPTSSSDTERIVTPPSKVSRAVRRQYAGSDARTVNSSTSGWSTRRVLISTSGLIVNRSPLPVPSSRQLMMAPASAPGRR